MSRIRILPDHLVSQIAAGEVVERPASVVKELVENALDAGSTEITLELENGGKRLVRIADNGCGMDRDDALLAFDRHATSKIATFGDLESVETLGFRGEALASIAAVSKVTLMTAARDGEGFRVRIEGGRVRGAAPAAAPPGTTIEVASLFYNVPARRSFLKTPRTELRRSAEVVQGYALARPDVGLTLWHGGREVLAAPAGPRGVEGLQRRIRYVFGDPLGRQLEAIGDDPGEGERGIWGFVGTPDTARSKRRFVFVNRRLVRDRAVLATFYRAVRDEWRVDDFPALFLFLDLPGAEVDVNVHPQKSEVRFRDGRLLGGVYETLRRALASARGEEAAPAVPVGALPRQPLVWQQERADSGGPTEAWRPLPAGEIRDGNTEAPRLAEVAYAPSDPRIVPLSGRSGEARSFRLLGQYKGTLVLLEGADGLYLIDQHVAHERILYERILRNLRRERPATQTLLEPLLIDLSAAEWHNLVDVEASLGAIGFEVAAVSGNRAAVTSVPAGLPVGQVTAILESALQRPVDETGQLEVLRRRLIEDAAASMACRSAVKMHEPLGNDEMERLVSELFDCEQPFACPHGRPILLKLSDLDLEKRFKRR